MKRFVLSVIAAGLLAVVPPGAPSLRAAAEGPQLEAAASSPEELARRFLEAVAADDLAAALTLALTQAEFARHVWPELPAADPARNLTADFVWNMTNLRGQSKLRTAMASIGGRRLELEEIRFTGGVTAYPTYRIHRNSLLVLKDEDGATQTVRLFGSVLEMNGGFKIYSFNY